MTWPAVVVAGVVAVVAAIFSTLKDFFSGELKAKNDQLNDENAKITAGNKAASDVDAMSRDEQLRYLEKRGRVRRTESYD